LLLRKLNPGLRAAAVIVSTVPGAKIARFVFPRAKRVLTASSSVSTVAASGAARKQNLRHFSRRSLRQFSKYAELIITFPAASVQPCLVAGLEEAANLFRVKKHSASSIRPFRKIAEIRRPSLY
jgi:hypothetical protein